MKELFAAWSLDWRTAVITAMASFLLWAAVKIRKQVREWITYAIEGALYAIGRRVRGDLARYLAVRRYCRLKLAEENRYLHVPSSLGVKLEVDRAFITLRLDQAGTNQTTHTHFDLLASGNRIRVVGDPGSGKSSLVKRLLRDACFKGVSFSRGAKLPILFELKNLKLPQRRPNDLGLWLLGVLRKQVSTMSAFQMEECFDAHATAGGLLVLLDGLDEVSTATYDTIQSALVGLSELLAKMSEHNVIVLTMRTQFHQQVREHYRESFGPAFYVKPFSPSDVYEFLSRWPFANDPAKEVARIYKELTDRPSLREMCTNPLVLSMYVAENQAEDRLVAPESRTEFYKKITDELVLRRRLQQTGPVPAHTKLKEQRERILGRIAYDHMLNEREPTNSLAWAAARDVVKDVMQCEPAAADAYLLDLAKETGLISEERPGETLRFIHLTFCEYLAAYEAVEGQARGWQALSRRHAAFRKDARPYLRSRLLEVIPFACGLMQRIARERALTDVATLGDRGLLARCLLETKLYEHPSWPELGAAQRSYLLSVPEEGWTEAWLRELHLFNVVVSDAANCASHSARISRTIDLQEFYQALLDQQRQSLSTLLAAYASQDAAAALRLAELSNLDIVDSLPELIISNCDQPAFLALLREQALNEGHRVGRWAALFSEAALRSSAVMKHLETLEPLPQWSKYVAELKRTEKIDTTRGWLDQCVSIARGPHAPRDFTFRLLNKLRDVPVPLLAHKYGEPALRATAIVGVVALLAVGLAAMDFALYRPLFAASSYGATAGSSSPPHLGNIVHSATSHLAEWLPDRLWRTSPVINTGSDASLAVVKWCLPIVLLCILFMNRVQVDYRLFRRVLSPNNRGPDSPLLARLVGSRRLRRLEAEMQQLRTAAA